MMGLMVRAGDIEVGQIRRWRGIRELKWRWGLSTGRQCEGAEELRWPYRCLR